jgi:hypothetical protein
MGKSNGPGEDQHERVNRELAELLQELRVALPGVQVLFAFLLTADYAFGATLAVISGVVATAVLGAFWAAIPLIRHPGRART